MPKISDPLIHAAADNFVEACLKSDGSLFTPGREVWTPTNLDDFHNRFVVHADESSDAFDVKLKRQLDGVAPDTAQLAGELVFVHLLGPKHMGGVKKRELIEVALKSSPSPISIPDHLLPVLDKGMAYTGIGMLTLRFQMLSFLLHFVTEWKKLPDEGRLSALEDPWRFRSFVYGLECYKAGSQREALLHFVHPAYFEPMTSKKDKTRVVETFADATDERHENRDRQILALRKALSPRFGEDFDFYRPDLVSIWKPYASWGHFVQWARRFYEWPGFEDAERTYKLEFAKSLLAARKAIEADEPDWISLLRKTVGSVNISQWRANNRLIDWCEREPLEARRALLELWTDEGSATERLQRFVTAWGDENRGARIRTAAMLLMAADPTSLPPFAMRAFNKAFQLTGHTKYASDADDATIYGHALSFLDLLIEKGREQGLHIRDRLDAQGLVWAITRWPEREVPLTDWSDEEQAAFLAFRGAPELVDDSEETEEEEEVGGGDDPPHVDVLAALGDELLLDRAFFATAVQLLRDKGQVVFYGPPGTGKTFVARRLASVLAGSSDRVTLVQFHPSYAYEDFIEGYRPSDGSGTSGFALESGPLIRIAKQARENPNDQYVLVVDEINRGNVAKVFGELYFLLEYRDEQINLQYSRDLFSLPGNLWIIGTMNTADRSIALMDAALRRRFYFLPFFPTEKPVQGLLRRWLERYQPTMLWVAEAMDRANKELDDPHFAIGPSYFLKRDLNRDWVETIWEHSVLPYLAERYFGAEDQLQRFTLEALTGEAPNALEESDEEPADGAEAESDD